MNQARPKLVVTILQCRRVVLPHIFVTNILPRMRKLFPGDIETVIVQHRGDASGGNPRLESNRLSTEQLDLVDDWTDRGMYEGADIVQHVDNHPPYPSIPGMHHCVRAALERKADYHLWLEDDALVFDQSCGAWNHMLGGSEVGVYRPFHHLNSAYLLTRPSFDRRLEEKLRNYSWWTKKRRLESVLRETMRTRRAYLPQHYAVRYHHRYYPHTGLRYLVEAVRTWAPESVELLDVDFGVGASLLPPVAPPEAERHQAAEGAKLMDRLWRMRQRAVERFLLPAGL